jgi:hypothetical protein
MCQLFISKDFETSLLTLLGVSLVLWRRKADNALSNPLLLWPSPLNSQHLHFQFPITSLLQILLEVVAIGRKNAGKDPDSAALWRIFSSNKSAPANRKTGFYTNRVPKKQKVGGIFVFSGSEV